MVRSGAVFHDGNRASATAQECDRHVQSDIRSTEFWELTQTDGQCPKLSSRPDLRDCKFGSPHYLRWMASLIRRAAA
jgi:hypothetical protein